MPLSVSVHEWDLLLVGVIIKTLAVLIAVAVTVWVARRGHSVMSVIQRGGVAWFSLVLAATGISVWVGLYARIH
jgi:hypothetical protein